MKDKVTSLFCLILVVFLTCGCATLRHAVPPELSERVQIQDMRDVRFFDDEPSEILTKDLITSFRQESSIAFPELLDGIRTYPVLVISGGGANGAYGAGLLKGWSDSGTRPIFKIVTGVSTGALIAPFAFLGQKYDAELENLYTTISTKDIMYKGNPLRLLFSDSLASSRPLYNLIRKTFTKKILQEIAVEDRHGRRLYVGTTNLDTQRLVIWDIGKIAAIGTDEAHGLFCRILLASSAIPAIFPPVFLNVEIGGKRYDEMHVDGGTVAQEFFLYSVLDGLKGVAANDLDNPRFKLRLYIIRNGYVYPVWKKVNDRLHDIAERSMDTMISRQGVGDIYRLYILAKSHGHDYNLAYIPSSFDLQPKEMFDSVYMRGLFDLGYRQAAEGYRWAKEPPDLENNK